MSGPPVYSFRKKVSEAPIMSFQTDKNGTFDPAFGVASGTLKWVIDGTTYITNAPSVALIGDTVDVEVFANDVPEGVNISSIFSNQKIIGDFDLAYFTLTSTLIGQTNAELTNVTFSSFTNTLSNCRITGSAITSLDFTDVLLTNQLLVGSNNLSSITFSSGANTLSVCQLQENALTSLDLSDVLLTGTFIANNNLFTTLAFSTQANVITVMQIVSCSNLTSLDLSNVTLSGTLSAFLCTSLASVTHSSYTTSVSNIRYETCALNLASVDSLFSTLNTFMSANAPTSNLTVDTSGGTNASPTDGSSNTDLVNLRDVVYPNAGFTFTATIN